jgi:very-short-patch-repair endonuclease
MRTLVTEQAGVISRTQALTVGLNLRQIDYRLKTGDWIKAYPGVYRMGVVPPTPEQQMRAAALWVDNGVLSGVGAAWWWELVTDPPLRWEFQVDSTTRRTLQSGVCLLRRWVDPYDVTSHRGVTVLARPLALLRAAVVLDRARRGQGVRLIDRSKQQDVVSELDLDEAFRRNRGTWGTTTMRDLLERTGDRAHSDLERLGVRLLTEAGIDGFVVNLRLRLSSGRPVELDIAFEEERVAIELDGFRYHSSSEAHAADLRRQNEVIADGWTLLRYDPDVLVETPGRFIREVRNAIGR